MKIHEYQAKDLFRQYDIPVPEGRLCYTSGQVATAAKELLLPVVVKAQIHAGGRGKGGGVKLARTEDDVLEAAESIIGMNLVTRQTGPGGRTVKKVLVEQGLSIRDEMYLSIVIDRSRAAISIISSREGGMDIEEVAANNPERIITLAIHPLLSIQSFHLRELCFGLQLDSGLMKEFSRIVRQLYKLFIEYDCSMLEINPLVITEDNRIFALDAKVDIDSNSLFRHPDIGEMHDPDEEDPAELEAAKYNLNYINLDGNVGNMVNGAGLAMATMDIIKQAGASPANFLDVGGSADAEMVEKGFKIILADADVKAVFINIFGGIFRCDILAQGIVQAASNLGINVPVVVRMEGTNVEEGRKILADSGLELINAVDLRDAAEKVAGVAN